MESPVVRLAAAGLEADRSLLDAGAAVDLGSRSNSTSRRTSVEDKVIDCTARPLIPIYVKLYSQSFGRVATPKVDFHRHDGRWQVYDIGSLTLTS